MWVGECAVVVVVVAAVVVVGGGGGVRKYVFVGQAWDGPQVGPYVRSNFWTDVRKPLWLPALLPLAIGCRELGADPRYVSV